MVYTKIHNKYYDLRNFIHPGGSVALSLASGRDSTELFELHHQYSDESMMTSLLKRYEVTEGTPIHSNDVYNWDKTLKSEFAKELKQIAKATLGTDIKASTERWIEYFVLFVLLLSQWYCFIDGFWFSLVSFPLMLWVFSVNVFHDGSHFSISRKWSFFNSLAMNTGFMLATPYHWYHQHTVGHHSFPNVMGRDPDLYHVPEVRHSYDVDLAPPHRIQHWSAFIISTFGIPGYYLCGGAMQCLLGFRYNGVVSLSSTWSLNAMGIPLRLCVYVVLMHVIPIMVHGLGIKGALFALVPEFIYTACFTICTQVNHLTPDCAHQQSDNFFIHQVITAHNISTDSKLTELFTGGLNMQIEHHLFPSVNHCHLRKLVPHVRALCAKHGVAYSESVSLWAALNKHVQHLFEMGYGAYSAQNTASTSQKTGSSSDIRSQKHD